jgi:hypothetical protein
MENQTEEKLYTEADLVSFGKHLLSEEREGSIKQHQTETFFDAEIAEEMAHEVFRSVTHAAVYNWKHEQGYPIKADAPPIEDDSVWVGVRDAIAWTGDLDTSIDNLKAEFIIIRRPIPES